MHWDLWKTVYDRRKDLDGVTFFEKRAGIRRIEGFVGKADSISGEGNWKNSKKNEKKNLKILCTDETSKQLVGERFLERSSLFTFFTDIKNFCDDFPDILNLANLLTLVPFFRWFALISETYLIFQTNSKVLSNDRPNLSHSDKLNESSNERVLERRVQFNSGTIFNGRYDWKLVKANIINLSSCHLSKDDVLLFSKGLKSVSTAKHINKAKIKKEIEVCGRKLRLMWHFRNDYREFINTNLT